MLNALWATLLTLGVTAVTVAFNLYMWSSSNLVLVLASPLVLILGLFLINVSFGYFFEFRGKRQLGRRFGQYVPPELVREMSENPEGYSLEGERREMTVLFSDVRGFTTISERLEPKEVSELLNAFLTPMTEIIHRHRGTIDKYMGDAIMAFWGAPLRDAEHASHAVTAVLEMAREAESLREVFGKRGWPEIRIGVGLNTGPMSVGNMGSEFRMAYTVLGDAVNLGARLEGLTKKYGVAVIVSEHTRDAAPDYAFRELDRVRVKGRDWPVSIFEPLGLGRKLSGAEQRELAKYNEALRLFREQQWDAAEARYRELATAAPESALYWMYLDRIAYFRAAPPGPAWDGVFTHAEK
jgi:adenylate cyclase